MTIVDVSPVEPIVVPPPRRRTLLPRNPTPWAPPDAQTLPPQVQRLLQQIGGSTYRTYQPFQVLQPFILPQNNPVPTLPLPDTPHSPPSSSSPNPQNTSETHSRPSSGDFSFDVRSNVSSPPEHTSSGGGPAPLTHLCRNQLVAHFGLRALRQLLLLMRAPKCVAKFLSTINAKECIVRSPAPLLDVFAEPFFHRAVTWRVVCSLDGQPYLATYAHTDMASLQERRWLTACWGEAGDPVGGAWLWCDHPHIMRVWGLVLDDVTGNTFYLLDTPIATLDQIQSRLTLWSVRVPESLIWCVVASVASALRHTLSHALQYAPLLLSNVFILDHAIAIENGLTRKKQLTVCSGCSSPHGRPPHHRPASEACMVHHVGQVIFALITCHLRATWTNVDHPHHNSVSYVKMMHVLREEYSGVLLRLLSRTLSGGLARAWAAAGGGQDGLVADRTARWEHTTRGRAKQFSGAPLDLDSTPLTMIREPLLPEPLPLPQFRVGGATEPYSQTQSTSGHLFQKDIQGQTDCSVSEEVGVSPTELPVSSSTSQHRRIPSPVPGLDARTEQILPQTDEGYSSGMPPTVRDAAIRKDIFDDGIRNGTVEGRDRMFERESGQSEVVEIHNKSRLRMNSTVKFNSECNTNDQNHDISVSHGKSLNMGRSHRLDPTENSSADHSTRPKGKPRDRRRQGDRRPKKHHKSSSSPSSEHRNNNSSKENISPNIYTNKGVQSKDSNSRIAGCESKEKTPGCSVTDCAPVSLAHIALLAEEQVVQRCVEGNLQDALRSCPQRLVHLALSQQP